MDTKVQYLMVGLLGVLCILAFAILLRPSTVTVDNFDRCPNVQTPEIKAACNESMRMQEEQ